MVTWQTKSLVQRIFSSLPKGEYWNYLCQRYITKGLPISYDKFVADVGSKVYEPLNVFMERDKNLSSKVYFEFGAGWDLLAPIGVSLAGMGYYAKYLRGGGVSIRMPKTDSRFKQ